MFGSRVYTLPFFVGLYFENSGRESMVNVVGVVSVVCALFYTRIHFFWPDNALGDVFVVLFYGVGGGSGIICTLQLVESFGNLILFYQLELAC